MSVPALATVGRLSTLMTISSVLEAQPGAEMVQRRVAEAPITKPVTAEVGEAGVVTVAVPDITDQAPVPEAGVLPARTVLFTLHKN